MFTKQQRRKIYMEIAKQIFEESLGNGFHEPTNGEIQRICVDLGYKMPNGYASTPYEEIESAFPEFFLFKRNRIGGWWEDNYRGNNERIIALLFCAEMCK